MKRRAKKKNEKRGKRNTEKYNSIHFMNISGVDWLISFLSALFCKSFSVPFPSGYTPSHSPFVSLCPIPFYSVLFCSILAHLVVHAARFGGQAVHELVNPHFGVAHHQPRRARKPLALDVLIYKEERRRWKEKARRWVSTFRGSRPTVVANNSS
jgi:hypothetical protein